MEGGSVEAGRGTTATRGRRRTSERRAVTDGSAGIDCCPLKRVRAALPTLSPPLGQVWGDGRGRRCVLVWEHEVRRSYAVELQTGGGLWSKARGPASGMAVFLPVFVLSGPVMSAAPRYGHVSIPPWWYRLRIS